MSATHHNSIVLLLVASVLTLSTTAARAVQLVTLDFDTYTTPESEPDDYVYAPDERMAIKGILEDLFRSDPGDPMGGPFGIKFDILDPLSPPPPFTTTVVKFNAGAFGSAEKIDFRNLDDDDDVVVNTLPTLKLFDGTERSPELGGGFWTVPELTDPHNVVVASAQIAAHEVGHALGLRHHDAFGPIGSGIGVAATKYLPTYPGPTLIGLTSQHIMGLNSSVALNANTLLTPSHFSERSALKMTLAAVEDMPGPNPYLISEDEYAIGDAHDDASLADTSPIPLMPIGVFNTLESPHEWAPIHGGPDVLPAAAAVVTAELEDRGPDGSDTDHFALTLEEPARVTIEVLSHSLRAEEGGRITDWVDTKLAVLGGPGLYPVPYESGEALSDDQFESLDPILFDVDLPAGDYVVEVFPYTAGETGDYELLVYAFPEVDFPLVGDYNDDGFVDAADYTVWRDAIGEPAGALANRDPANTGLISGDDFLSWTENYGEFSLAALDALPGSSVPEPAAMLLLGLGSLASLGRRQASSRPRS